MNSKAAIFLVVALPLLLLPEGARAQTGTLDAKLVGVEEVPAISTRGTGRFAGELSSDETSIDWTLKWKDNLTANVAQAHIHFAQAGVNGGIVVFLCTNLGNGPVGTPPCPVGAGEVSGTIDAGDVLAIAGQGIGAGQFGKLVRAIKAGAAYANIHTTAFASGEIRGQIDYTPLP